MFIPLQTPVVFSVEGRTASEDAQLEHHGTRVLFGPDRDAGVLMELFFSMWSQPVSSNMSKQSGLHILSI